MSNQAALHHIGVVVGVTTPMKKVSEPSACSADGYRQEQVGDMQNDSLITSVAIGLSLLVSLSGITFAGTLSSVPAYTVAYSGNGGASGAAPVDSSKYASRANVTLAGTTGNLTKSGCTFSGWNTAANGAGTSYAVGANLVMGTANVTLYAQWVSSSSGHTVTYVGNGSISGAGPSDPNLYASGDAVMVLGNIGPFLKAGYTFVGWNSEANGAGASYTAGASFAMGSANVVLYAQWNHENLAVSVWGGAREAVVLKADGSVWTWGLNTNGQLGDGTTIDSSVPMPVLGSNGVGHLGGVVAIMGGEAHNVALKSDGTVWNWGMNMTNQLGNGNASDSSTPVQVSGLNSVVSLGGLGYHSLAVNADGSVFAWGWNYHGALGNVVADRNYDNPVPVQVQGLTHPIMVTSGYCFNVALLQDETLVAWGNNGNGELGDGTTTDRYTPVPVIGLKNVIWVSAGWTHVVAIKSDGTVWTWGANYWGGAFPGAGMLDDGTTQDHWTPEQVPGLGGAIQAFGGDGHTAVLLRDGSVWTFGANGARQLGTGSITTQSVVPVRVQGLGNVNALTARDFHNQVIRTDGTIWSWGSGLNGELGNGTR